jgi:UDPglucose 6-dehydrogenase
MEKVIAQIGYGFVGGALSRSLRKKGHCTLIYDKYQNINSPEDVLNSDFLFMCLPTPYVEGHGFDLSALVENLKFLSRKGYTGLVIIKSTVEPGTTEKLNRQFRDLWLCHNPEFLTARTADEDFHNQKHIVLGYNQEVNNSFLRVMELRGFFEETYPGAKISVCTSQESESMKLFCNNFYAMKIQIFNEFYFLCQKLGIDYDKVKDLMLSNEWINPMHTVVPGPDGQVSYGNLCFPKDTNALKHLMKTVGSPHKVLEACIEERDSMREFKLK